MASIRRQSAYAKNAYTYYPVVIVGAGESGIAMGCQLKEVLGFDQFRIFDRQSGIGGTWWINRYPGAACDVPAIFYSFSFAQNPNWTSPHPSGPEIAEYLAAVCAKYEIVDKIQFHTEVREVKWLGEEEEWQVTLSHLVPGTGDWSASERRNKIATDGESSVYIATEVVRAKIVVSAVGGLVEPQEIPKDIPGWDKFEGDIIHTAKWKQDVDLSGKDVVVLGTGASAAQVVPGLVKGPYNVKSVTQLMRTPPWVRPFSDDPESIRRWAKYAPPLMRNVPGLMHMIRFLFFIAIEYEFFAIFANTDYTRRHLPGEEEVCRKYMRELAPSRYFDILEPNHRLGCKRRVIGGEWYRSLHHPKVELTSRRLKSVEARSVTLGSKQYPREDKKATTDDDEEEKVQLPADVIVLANGYRTNEWLRPLRVVGKGGHSIHDVWEQRGGPQAYLGIAMDKFPNFFMIFGPNMVTGHTSVILASENAVQYSLKFMKPILDGSVSTWEVKEEAEREWTAKVQNELKHTTFFSGCTSWYTQPNGWNSTAYPFSQIDYTIRSMFPVWRHWDVKYTKAGINRRRRRQLVRTSLLAAIIGIYIWSRKRPAALQSARNAIARVITSALGSVIDKVNRSAV